MGVCSLQTQKAVRNTVCAPGGGTAFPPDGVTFEQVAHQREVEVGAEVQAHEVIHLRTVPLQRTPDLHEHFFWTLQEKTPAFNNTLDN